MTAPVTIARGLEGAKAARGSVVVIDVLRAFTVAAVAFEAGAARLVMTDSVEETRALKAKGKIDFTAGERGGKRAPGFDFPNSPVALADADLDGKVLGLTTTNGTAGLAAAARRAERLYAGALVTAVPLAQRLQADMEAGLPITLVAMGRLTGPTLEDDLCAYVLEALIYGRSPDPYGLASVLQTTLKPIRPELIESGDYDPGDREMAFDLGRCPFFIAVRKERGLLIAEAAAP